MTLDQDALHRHAVGRITRARPEFRDNPAHLSTVDEMLAVEAVVGAGTAVVAIVRHFDIAAFVRGTIGYAAGLGRADEWRRSFTKTLFLAGNPARLMDRFTFRHVDPTATMAWTVPAPPATHQSLRRLLRAFVGERKLTVPGDLVIDPPAEPGAERTLYIADTGLTIAQAMIHLSHLLVEAVFDGVLTPDDRLAVRAVPRLVGIPGPFDALRVGVDPTLPGRLHALMGLTTEVTSA